MTPAQTARLRAFHRAGFALADSTDAQVCQDYLANEQRIAQQVGEGLFLESRRRAAEAYAEETGLCPWCGGPVDHGESGF